MVSRRAALIVLAVALLLFAGCTAPSATPDVDDGEIEADNIPDEDGESDDVQTDADSDDASGDDESADGTDDGPDDANEDVEPSDYPELDLNENVVWNDVTKLIGSDAPQPNLFVDEMPPGASDAFEPQQSDFQEALNATETASGGNGSSGLATPGNVYVFPDGPDKEIEQVLVHEYTHTIQYAEGMFASWLRSPPETTYEDLVQTALIEGGAVYVADEYTGQYLDGIPLQSEQMQASYEAAPAGDRLLFAPYYFGAEYIHDDIESADELPEVYSSPPLTTSELLHPDREPPATDLTVDVDNAESDWTVARTDRQGELYTRIVLDTELSNDEAVEAAAGWSDDELLAFTDEGQDGFAWTTQWASSDDADEFEAAFESKLDQRTDEWVDRTTVERVDDRTVAVVIGPERFRAAVDISASGNGVDLVVTEPTSAAETAMTEPSLVASTVSGDRVAA
jgi:hypothetical protein